MRTKNFFAWRINRERKVEHQLSYHRGRIVQQRGKIPCHHDLVPWRCFSIHCKLDHRSLHTRSFLLDLPYWWPNQVMNWKPLLTINPIHHDPHPLLWRNQAEWILDVSDEDYIHRCKNSWCSSSSNDVESKLETRSECRRWCRHERYSNRSTITRSIRYCSRRFTRWNEDWIGEPSRKWIARETSINCRSLTGYFSTEECKKRQRETHR